MKQFFPIRYKFLLVTVALIFASITTYLLLAIHLFNSDKTAYIYEGSSNLVEALGAEVETDFLTILKTVRATGTALQQNFATPAQRITAANNIFRTEDNLVELQFFPIEAGKTPTPNPKHQDYVRLINNAFLTENKLSPTYLERVGKERPVAFSQIMHRKLILQNASLPNGIPLITMGLAISSRENGPVDRIIIALLRQDRRFKIFQRSVIFSTYLLDNYGNLLVHPKIERVLRSENVRDLPYIKPILASKMPSGAKEVELADRTKLILSFKQVNFGNLTIISEIPKDKAFLASRKLVEKSILFAILILCVGVIISVLFTRTLTRALQKLHAATGKIAQGDFNIEIKIETRDEIGTLGQSFNHMTKEILRLMAATAQQARMEKELETAQLVQNNLFPKDRVDFGPLQLASYYKSASECGGDWWGYIEKGPKVAVFIADATGHGVPAALITAAAHSCSTTLDYFFRRFEQLDLDPAFMMEGLNLAVLNAGRGHVKMTFFAAVFDRAQSKLTYANAGHEMPFLYHKPPKDNPSKPDRLALDGEPQSALGQNPDTKYTNYEISLEADDTIIFYTDGVTERRNPEMDEWGERRLLRKLDKIVTEDIVAIKDIIVQELDKFSAGRPDDDDTTFVLARFGAATA